MEEELVAGCFQLTCSHFSALLQQYAWGNQKTHSKNQGILVCTENFFLLYQNHLIVVLLIFLCNKSNFWFTSELFFFFYVWQYSSAFTDFLHCLIYCVSDTVGWFGVNLWSQGLWYYLNALLIYNYTEKKICFWSKMLNSLS